MQLDLLVDFANQATNEITKNILNKSETKAILCWQSCLAKGWSGAIHQLIQRFPEFKIPVILTPSPPPEELWQMNTVLRV